VGPQPSAGVGYIPTPLQALGDSLAVYWSGPAPPQNPALPGQLGRTYLPACLPARPQA
jgi:hypothetical protein